MQTLSSSPARNWRFGITIYKVFWKNKLRFSLLRIYHVANYYTAIKQQLKVNKVRNVLPALSAAGTQQLQPEPEQPPDSFTSPWEQRFLHLPWASVHLALILQSARKSRKWTKIKADVKDEALRRGFYFVACMRARVLCVIHSRSWSRAGLAITSCLPSESVLVARFVPSLLNANDPSPPPCSREGKSNTRRTVGKYF